MYLIFRTNYCILFLLSEANQLASTMRGNRIARVWLKYRYVSPVICHPSKLFSTLSIYGAIFKASVECMMYPLNYIISHTVQMRKQL